jgi:hypothetical protein
MSSYMLTAKWTASTMPPSPCLEPMPGERMTSIPDRRTATFVTGLHTGDVWTVFDGSLIIARPGGQVLVFEPIPTDYVGKTP